MGKCSGFPTRCLWCLARVYFQNQTTLSDCLTGEEVLFVCVCDEVWLIWLFLKSEICLLLGGVYALNVLDTSVIYTPEYVKVKLRFNITACSRGCKAD